MQHVSRQELEKIVQEYMPRVQGYRPYPKYSPEAKARIAAAYDDFVKLLDVNYKGEVAGTIFQALVNRDNEDQPEGEYVNDPAGVTIGETDVMGDTDQALGGAKLRINLCLDASASMLDIDGLEINPHYGHIGHEGEPGYYEKAGVSPLLLLPRLFYASLIMNRMHKHLTEAAAEAGADNLKVASYVWALGGGRVTEPYDGGVWYYRRDAGNGTYFGPLLDRIIRDERLNQDEEAIRLDFVITDGGFSSGDRAKATAAQEERINAGNGVGSVKTIVLNVVPSSMSGYSDQHIKDHAAGIEVFSVKDATNMMTVVSNVSLEFLESLKKDQ